MVDVETRITIEADRGTVSSFACDPANAPQWYSNIKHVEWRTEPEIRLGAQAEFVAHFLGKRLRYVYEIVELEPERRMVMRTADGPFPMNTEYGWVDAGSGATEMTLRNYGDPSGLFRLTGPAMELAMRRANRKDLERLKAIIESRRDDRTFGV